MAQQTAVEWLVGRLFVYGLPDQRCYDLVQEAKQIEKEQALGLADEAYEAGRLHEEHSHIFDDPKGRFMGWITDSL